MYSTIIYIPFLASILSLFIICYFYQFYFGLYLICSLFFFLLLVFNILSAHNILNEFCVRKGINSFNISSNKLYLFFFIILMLLIPLFNFCIGARLFATINNIAVSSFKGIGISHDIITLFISALIFILLISTVLS